MLKQHTPDPSERCLAGPLYQVFDAGKLFPSFLSCVVFLLRFPRKKRDILIHHFYRFPRSFSSIVFCHPLASKQAVPFVAPSEFCCLSFADIPSIWI